jgi:ADP-ribosylglycohydrolase
MKSRDRFRGCLVGLAAGDAVGMPLEGHDRERLEPVTTMTGGGPFNRPPGHWTDDTAMAICLGESLIESNGFDARDQAIARGEYRARPEAMIHGSGYVVECLEAALWCFERADGFVEAVLTAANLGEDADTTAAVCGQIAGAFYGIGQIPEDWLDQLLMREELERLADRLML